MAGKKYTEKTKLVDAQKIYEPNEAFGLLKQHLIEDDAEVDRIYQKYKKGELTSGEVKEIACEKMTAFMYELEHGIKDARKKVAELKFVKQS